MERVPRHPAVYTGPGATYKTKMSRLSQLIRSLKGPPVRARHVAPSFLISLEDDPATADDFLFDLSLETIDLARRINLDDIAARNENISRLVRCWPGEHYRLLGAMVQVLSPKTVIEIGTGTGKSALAMLKFMAPEARLHTFDLIPWREYPGHIFCDADFRDGRLVQTIDDLSTREGFLRHIDLVRKADFMFIDAAKDGVMEERLLRYFSDHGIASRAVLIFDDIRVCNMLSIWRKIASPKIDLTSFGHFTGTGVTYAPIRLVW